MVVLRQELCDDGEGLVRVHRVVLALTYDFRVRQYTTKWSVWVEHTVEVRALDCVWVVAASPFIADTAELNVFAVCAVALVETLLSARVRRHLGRSCVGLPNVELCTTCSEVVLVGDTCDECGLGALPVVWLAYEGMRKGRRSIYASQ